MTWSAWPTVASQSDAEEHSGTDKESPTQSASKEDADNDQDELPMPGLYEGGHGAAVARRVHRAHKPGEDLVPSVQWRLRTTNAVGQSVLCNSYLGAYCPHRHRQDTIASLVQESDWQGKRHTHSTEA